MPLVRFNVRNVYGLGTPDLYATQAKKDDPKAILDGVAVAGLVGVLRQLGDLAEFAAEIFNGLQEQVTATSSRSQKMIARIQLMEEELPRLEKVVFSQTEHIHFAYTAGSYWHPDHQPEENRIVRSYLPPFMLDSYEECRDPPSLHLLDKMPFTSPSSSERSSTGGNISIPRSEIEDGSTSYGSRRSDSIDCVLDMRTCVPLKEEEHRALTNSMLKMQSNEIMGSIHPRQQKRNVNDVLPHQEDMVSTSSSVTWDEKTEILKSPSPPNTIVEDQRQISGTVHAVSYQKKLLNESAKLENADSAPSIYYDDTLLESHSTANISEGEESQSESYKDALNTTASEIEPDAEKQTQRIKEPPCTDLRAQSSPSDVQPCVIKRSPGHVTRNTVNTDFDEVTHIDDVPRETGGETSSTDPLSPSLYKEKTDSSVCSPKESFPENSCSSEVKLWTNGGLLGLAPSKPPDFNVLDGANQNLMSFDDHSVSSDSTMSHSHHSESPATVPDASGSFEKAGSSSIIQPRYRLVANKFRKRTSLSHDDTPKPYSLHASPRNSRSCSPPLEHMKISFHPNLGSEISKMKLEFQDDNKDSTFPSFQLLPEPDINSESDGDTFSRSSEYMSDQFLSELNETASEQWACDETPLNEENEVYDSLRRVSSAESISRSSEMEVKDDTIYPCDETPLNEENEVHSSLRRISSAESISRSSEVKDDTIYPGGDSSIPKINPHHESPPSIVLYENDHSVPLELPNESLPPPPPLPPRPWNVTKPEEDLVEDDHYSKPESTVNQVQNSSNGEDKDDFLNQIRLKSLTLKRTATARPALRPRPVTDMRVTAIILKANALRQAFMGSDDEDDSDDWSDN
ncbi:phosphoenolpyruvate carboxylase [Ranunculus cassubicifolius]